MVGKWHVGYGADHLMPLNHGFDEYLGLPYSNDMWPYHYGDHERGLIGNPNWPDLPLIDGNETIELNPRQDSLTPRYTERALDFIDRAADRPLLPLLRLLPPARPDRRERRLPRHFGPGPLRRHGRRDGRRRRARSSTACAPWASTTTR